MTDLIFVDIETTGTEHWAKVWEIAALTLDGDLWHAAWQPPLAGAVLAGASVHFDLAHLQRFAGKSSSKIAGGCHLRVSHRLLDVCTYAAAVAGTRAPCSLRDAAAIMGIDYDPARHHGALYDAWLARQVYGVAHHERNDRWPDGWVDVDPDVDLLQVS